MRNVSKLLTCSMIAGAALLSACGGGAEETNNATMTDMNATDTMMDGTTNDVTAIDAGTGADANMTMDANMTGDTTGGNTTGGDTANTTTDANMTNGM